MALKRPDSVELYYRCDVKDCENCGLGGPDADKEYALFFRNKLYEHARGFVSTNLPDGTVFDIEVIFGRRLFYNAGLYEPRCMLKIQINLEYLPARIKREYRRSVANCLAKLGEQNSGIAKLK